MKKIWWCLGLTLLLAVTAGVGGLASSQAFGQYYDPYYPYTGSGYCYEYPYTYCDYYYAPYADPYTQFFFYSIPDERIIIREPRRFERREERREWREERREREGRRY